MTRGKCIVPMVLIFLAFKGISFNEVPAGTWENDFKSKIEFYGIRPENFAVSLFDYRDIPKDTLHFRLEWLKSYYENDTTVFNAWQRAAILFTMGQMCFGLNLTDSSITCLSEAVELIDKEQFPLSYMRIKYFIGYVCLETGYYTQSNENLFDIIDMNEMRRDSVLLSRTMTFLAENHLNLFEYNKSMQFCKEAYALHIKLKDYDRASYVLVMMSQNISHIENDTSYMEYLLLANEMASLSGKPWRIGNNLVNTGIAYFNEGLYLKALDYLKRGWEIDRHYSTHGDLYGSMWLAKTYVELDSAQAAFYHAKRTIEIATGINEYSWIYESYETMAWYYEKINRLDSARSFLMDAIQLEKATGRYPSSSNYYKRLSEICLKMEDFYGAAHYLDTSYNLYIEIADQNNKEEMIKARAEFDYDLQKARIEELLAKQQLEQVKATRLIILTSATTLILLISVLFTVVLRKKLSELKQSYQYLVRKNIELDNASKKVRDFERSTGKNNHEENILQNLIDLLEKDRIYRDQDISLTKLADMLSTNTSYLSAIINSNFQMNFKSLIHKYRIDNARILLVADEFKNFSIEGIAQEVGYKSRSLFHQMFKEITGVTPAVYMQNYQYASQLPVQLMEEDI